MALKCLGKLPARVDHRLPRLSKHLPKLGAPPDNINMYAVMADWLMLANNTVSNCTVAGSMHAIMQLSAYAGKTVRGTDAEAISNYSAVGGYLPGDPATDQGLYMMGPGSLTERWMQAGLLCGGLINRATGVMQITRPNPVEWRQAIDNFGGVLLGIQLPESIATADVTPGVWSDYSGPVGGGHEIYGVGAELVGGERLYDIISWGQRYRATEDFLVAVVDEAVVVVDDAFLDASGKNPVGLDLAALVEAMTELRGEG